MDILTGPTTIYRIGRREDPWALYPPSGKGRFDIPDPDHGLTTIYTGESAEAAFAEVLAPLRPDLQVLSAIQNIPADDSELKLILNRIPETWRTSRLISHAILGKIKIVDISTAKTIALLRNVSHLARIAFEMGFSDLDDAALKDSSPSGRKLTQAVAQYLHENGFDGIRYSSRLGHPYSCIAGFVSTASLSATQTPFLEECFDYQEISKHHPALKKVTTKFGLEID